MGYCPYYCVICGCSEDNGWGNEVGETFKNLLKDKGYDIYEDNTDICPDCLDRIIRNFGDSIPDDPIEREKWYKYTPLDKIPKEYITKNIIINAIDNDFDNVKFIPVEFRSDEIYQELLEKYSSIYLFIPDDHMTKNMFMYSIKQSAYRAEYIPDKYKSKEFYEELKQINKDVEQYIPDIYK